MSAPASYPASLSFQRRTVWISADVLEIWNSHRQIHPHQPESFGVLVGSASVDHRQLWVSEATVPMPGDTQSRRSFELKDAAHQKLVDDSFAKSNSTEVYLGTWHTHPEQTPQPSGVDRADWRSCQRRNPGRPLVFAIVGTEVTRLFFRRRVRFSSMGALRAD